MWLLCNKSGLFLLAVLIQTNLNGTRGTCIQTRKPAQWWDVWHLLDDRDVSGGTNPCSRATLLLRTPSAMQMAEETGVLPDTDGLAQTWRNFFICWEHITYPLPHSWLCLVAWLQLICPLICYSIRFRISLYLGLDQIQFWSMISIDLIDFNNVRLVFSDSSKNIFIIYIF
jgi:hypothetical protein